LYSTYIGSTHLSHAMALLGANYFSGLGCEFGVDKVNSNFNGPSATSTSPGGWFGFFALDKDSFNDYEQVEGRFMSTRQPLDDRVGTVRPTQLSVSLDNFMSKLLRKT
jgi:hypothetical protein